jgi:SPP1 family predicted phage head-tail adaptor
MRGAGTLDRLIRFEHAAETTSASGEVSLTWALLVEVWGSKEPLTGRELFAAQQASAKVDTRFRVRYSPAVDEVSPDETYRIICEGKTYDITSVLETGRREGLEILAETRADQ